MNRYPRLIFVCSFLLPVLLWAQGSRTADDAVEGGVFELPDFVVYAGVIDVIDGFTGKPYPVGNPVVDGFRADFNKLLKGYHGRILVEEDRHLFARLKESEAYEAEMVALADSFGVTGYAVDHRRQLQIERAIFGRLLKDPFFKIKSLVVWDLDRLKKLEPSRPDSSYASDIRYNAEAGRWERRVTTRWKVDYLVGGGRWHRVLKEQGLNLDTNKGYHFVDQGLTGKVTPSAFSDVILSYPIFINSEEGSEIQIKRLQETFIINLMSIYDPFSWGWRRNERYRTGVVNRVANLVEQSRFRVSDRDWFDRVLAHFLHDVVTVRLQGVNEVYSFAMLQKAPVNRNILGQGLDLLNWNDGENRSVDYDPEYQGQVRLNFDQVEGARFILLDAYRRYGDSLVVVLRNKLASLDSKMSGKDLIKEVIAELSGVSADAYIKAAARAQRAELEKFRYEF